MTKNDDKNDIIYRITLPSPDYDTRKEASSEIRMLRDKIKQMENEKQLLEGIQNEI